MKNIENIKPKLRGHLHQSMFFTAMGACCVLISLSSSSLEFVSTSVYSICTLLMFGISAMYHRVNWSDSQRAVMRKLDHSGIYLMIAGTFTPICGLALSSSSAKTILLIIWFIAIIGIIKSVFLTNLPKFLNAIFCLIAGYMIVPYLGELSESIGLANIILIALGGVFYSVGALAYALKRPNLVPGVFGYHEFFHLFVNLAAIFHFIVILSIVKLL